MHCNVAFGRRKRVLQVFAFAATAVAAYLLYTHIGPSSGIFPYDPARDRAFILDQFKKNWYCLVSEKVTFSPEHMLDTRSSSQEPGDFGNASIYVYRDGDVDTGFLVIHPKHGQGYVLFLEVAEEHRKKGYGRKMLDFALKELRNKGFVSADLATRVENIPAQKLYHSFGFFEIDRYEGFITLRTLL